MLADTEKNIQIAAVVVLLLGGKIKIVSSVHTHTHTTKIHVGLYTQKTISIIGMDILLNHQNGVLLGKDVLIVSPVHIHTDLLSLFMHE
jgi:hypothetical protein